MKIIIRIYCYFMISKKEISESSSTCHAVDVVTTGAVENNGLVGCKCVGCTQYYCEFLHPTIDVLRIIKTHFHLQIFHGAEFDKIMILWRVYPLLGNGSVNIFPQHKRSTIEGHPLLSNGPVNMHSSREKKVFSVGSVRSGYDQYSAGQK
jgi:hypothetical protein